MLNRTIGIVLLLLAYGPALLAQPQFRNAGAFLISEEITNRVIQTGERVTVGLALKNIGGAVASNLVATIQTGNGVSDPAPASQSYGLLGPSAQSVARQFEFTCTAESNTLLNVVLDLTDDGIPMGSVTFRFRVGGAVTRAESIQTVTINPVGPAVQFPSVLSVTNTAGIIAKVSVTLSNLTHPFTSDLDILLVSPGGDAVLLMSDTCGDTPIDKLTLTFSDAAEALLPDLGLPLTRLVRPTNYLVDDAFPHPAPLGPYAGVLSAFNGKEAYGDWKLYIYDDFTPDGGALERGWALEITTLQPVDTAPTLKFLGRTDDMIQFEVRGRPGYKYAIESATEPDECYVLDTFKMPPSGSRIFEYPLTSTNEYFRAATDP